mgnify:CR=1 FL=1
MTRTIVLVAAAVTSVVVLFSQHPIERECLAYRAEIVYSATAGHYVIAGVPCVEQGGWYSR